MSNYTKEDIFRMVEEEDVEFIRLQFTDIFGTLKNVAITSSQLEKALDNKCMFDGSSIEGFVRIEESDMYLYPDLDNDILMCIPEPLIPNFGFGIKLANNPWRFAIVFTASLKVIMLSAVTIASSYLKSISCCAGATS